MSPTRSTRGGSTEEARDSTHYVLGGEHVGIATAERLRANGHRVVFVDEAHDADTVPEFAGDPAAVDVLSASGVGNASTVVVATHSDSRNLLIAQLVRAQFDVPRVVVIVNDPDRRSLFAEAGHEPFCATTALAEAVGDVV
jgi:Trk K+ transport system NAD-binding subunit